VIRSVIVEERVEIRHRAGLSLNGTIVVALQRFLDGALFAFRL